jgi:MFS transporter, ACS family, tartrate transporter
MDLTSSLDSELEQRTLRKVFWRLLPFLLVLYLFNYIDRLNVGAAQLTMKSDLGFSERMFGFGTSLFFIGYFIFEVPSNLIMERVGARRWIARIMISWGIISALMMFATTPFLFGLLRFLLGVAEAGFFPGIVLYFTYWFPRAVRARAMSRFVIATAFSGIIGNFLAAQLLQMDGIAGLKGWQWLFLLEGLPSVFLGISVLWVLSDNPQKAPWLSPEERDYLVTTLERERAEANAAEHMTFRSSLRHPTVWRITALFFLLQICGYGMDFYSNEMLKVRSTWDKSQILYLNMIPATFGAIAMLLSGYFSDKTRQRKPFVAFSMGLMGVFFFIVAFTPNPYATLACFTLIVAGKGAFNAPFWTMTTETLTGTAAAGGIAFINSMGNMGGFVSPIAVSNLKASTGNYTASLVFLSACALLSMAITLTLPKSRPKSDFPPAS